MLFWSDKNDVAYLIFAGGALLCVNSFNCLRSSQESLTFWNIHIIHIAQNCRVESVVGSGNSTFLQNYSEFRKHKKPRIQFFTFLNHQNTEKNSSFFGFSSCAVNLKKSSTFLQKCNGIFKFVQLKQSRRFSWFFFSYLR